MYEMVLFISFYFCTPLSKFLFWKIDILVMENVVIIICICFFSMIIFLIDHKYIFYAGRVSMIIVLVYLICHSPKLILTFCEIMFKNPKVSTRIPMTPWPRMNCNLVWTASSLERENKSTQNLEEFSVYHKYAVMFVKKR